jgi:hypothetical protein
LTGDLSEKTLSLIVPGAIRLKNNPVKVRLRKSLKEHEEAYRKWKTAARIWALYSIDSENLPFKDPCKVEVRIYYSGKGFDLTEGLESIGDCFEGILWFDQKQINSWDGSKMIEDNVYPRLDIRIRWRSR